MKSEVYRDKVLHGPKGRGGLEVALHIYKSDTIYPSALKICLDQKSPEKISAIGDIDILKNKPLAVFSSTKCPGSIILKTYDLMKRFRESGVTIVSGFHSPIEKECLNILLKGKQPVITCLARSIEGMRIRPEYKKPLEEGRLLILSHFAEKAKRISAERALERNRFIAALADSIFIPYAEPNSKTESFCKELIEKGKPILTFDGEHNKNLIGFGVRLIETALQAYKDVGGGLIKQ